jgi:predicted alpha/beta-fold hydrolase
VAIQTPTIILTAADDPFIDVQDYREARLSGTTRLHIERVGGHMGYLSQEKGRWLDYAIGQSFESLASC